MLNEFNIGDYFVLKDALHYIEFINPDTGEYLVEDCKTERSVWIKPEILNAVRGVRKLSEVCTDSEQDQGIVLANHS
jgi:hypothetical protein